LATIICEEDQNNYTSVCWTNLYTHIVGTHLVLLGWNYRWCLGYLKTSNTEPTDWVYKKHEGVFILSGREVTQCMAIQQSPIFHC